MIVLPSFTTGAMHEGKLDTISPGEAQTLAGLFRERVRRSPDAVAYRQFDDDAGVWRDTTWAEMASGVARWQAALLAEGLEPGDRVAILLRNCREWVQVDQAALGCGLVVVPLYTEDRAENIAYVLQNAGARLLVIGGPEHWDLLSPVADQLGFLRRVVSLRPLEGVSGSRVVGAADWLPAAPADIIRREVAPDALATIVYTSGTTGRPKGVMLSHRNILWNAHSALRRIDVYTDDILLSFLPLSHTFERTVGYYLCIMAGATVAYNRSIPQLAEDLQTIRPTLLIAVPRIFERVANRIRAQLQERPPMARRLFGAAVDVGWRRFEYRQGRGPWRPGLLTWPLLAPLVAAKVMAKLGGRVRLAVCGGAPLAPEVARLFIGLGLPVLQGYGLTETSPVIAANTLDDNEPTSVGRPLPDVEICVAEGEELLVRSPGVMLGYWDNPEATSAMIDAEGWLHTGDKVRIEDGHIHITGRLKEIIVLANGEKVPPADMEMAIGADPLFEQVMVVGDQRPYLTALVVLGAEEWPCLARHLHLNPDAPGAIDDPRVGAAVQERISSRLTCFPGYAQVHGVACLLTPWSVDSGLITPTLKLRRSRILEHYRDVLDRLYAGH